jgi:hypothetical protein
VASPRCAAGRKPREPGARGWRSRGPAHTPPRAAPLQPSLRARATSLPALHARSLKSARSHAARSDPPQSCPTRRGRAAHRDPAAACCDAVEALPEPLPAARDRRLRYFDELPPRARNRAPPRRPGEHRAHRNVGAAGSNALRRDLDGERVRAGRGSCARVAPFAGAKPVERFRGCDELRAHVRSSGVTSGGSHARFQVPHRWLRAHDRGSSRRGGGECVWQSRPADGALARAAEARCIASLPPLPSPPHRAPRVSAQRRARAGAQARALPVAPATERDRPPPNGIVRGQRVPLVCGRAPYGPFRPTSRGRVTPRTQR